MINRLACIYVHAGWGQQGNWERSHKLPVSEVYESMELY